MALSPLDIHNKEFKRVFRGYDEEEVDEFLDQVIDEFEKLYKENFELKEKLETKQGNIEEYKGLEETLKNTLIMAQHAAEDAKKNAEREAEVIFREAQMRAEALINEAKEKAERIVHDYQHMEIQVQQFKVRFRAFLQAQIDMVDKEVFTVND